MIRLFALGFEGTQSAIEWLCPVRVLCLFCFVLVLMASAYVCFFLMLPGDFTFSFYFFRMLAC